MRKFYLKDLKQVTDSNILVFRKSSNDKLWEAVQTYSAYLKANGVGASKDEMALKIQMMMDPTLKS